MTRKITKKTNKKVSEKDTSESSRLQKYLAACGVCSRRAGEKLILEGRVKVDGKKITQLGFCVDPETVRVEVDNVRVSPEEKGIILLNKPKGVITSKDDPHGRSTVVDYLPSRFKSYFPVGRLDYDSSGLVILTNDGELALKLLHPRYGFAREYEVLVQGVVVAATLKKLKKGVMLEDGYAKAEVTILGNNSLESKLHVVIGEGRNRIVRRMLSCVGHNVIKLHRSKHGPFSLSKLKSGEVKRLSRHEYETLRLKVMGRA